MQMIELKYYTDLLPECNIFTVDNMVELFFHDMETKAYYIAREFAKQADESYVVENAFSDDNTINHVVRLHLCNIFSRKQTDRFQVMPLRKSPCLTFIWDWMLFV